MYIATLRALMAIYGIDQESWERPLHDLLDEVNRKETRFSIDNDGLTRHISVVCAHILSKDNHKLVEREQVLPNGTVRHRNIPPSGKLFYGENPKTAILRELNEEIGFSEVDFVSISASDIRTKMEMAHSYPGLMTVFTYYDFNIVLTEGAYKDHYVKTEEDGTRTIFGWE